MCALNVFGTKQLHCVLTVGSKCLFDLVLYVPVHILSVMLGQVFLRLTSNKRLNWLAQGHNTVPPRRLVPAIPQS